MQSHHPSDCHSLLQRRKSVPKLLLHARLQRIDVGHALGEGVLSLTVDVLQVRRLSAVHILLTLVEAAAPSKR